MHPEELKELYVNEKRKTLSDDLHQHEPSAAAETNESKEMIPVANGKSR